MKDPNQVPSQETGQLPAWKTDLAYDSTTPIVNVPPEASGTTVQVLDNSFNDDVAQYMKGDNVELLRISNQAVNAVGPDVDNSKPPLIGRQDSDPKEG